jgi:hypothetical protein
VNLGYFAKEIGEKRRNKAGDLACRRGELITLLLLYEMHFVQHENRLYRVSRFDPKRPNLAIWPTGNNVTRLEIDLAGVES